MDRIFTVDQARALLPEIRAEVADLIELRAELAEGAWLQREGEDVNLADLKAMEARFGEILDSIRARGIQVKGWAPVLLDFPAVADGEDVLLCWIEGEPGLEWYHHAEQGFAGRRPLSDLDA